MTVLALPSLSVVIPTFNNRPVLERCLDSWEQYAARESVELIVVEDGCADDTAEFLRRRTGTPWGQRYLRWFHEEDVHQLVSTNRGLTEGRAPLLLTWDDDMFLRSRYFVREMRATFNAYPELGLLNLSRGLNWLPFDEPIQRWEDLHIPQRLQSTIGPAPWNWLRLQEVDGVIRPWVVRRACLEKVGLLDEAFRPAEWDEADLCFRLRQAGWKAAAHNYERLGYYEHLGSSTLKSTFSDRHKKLILKNGLLFHERWDDAIRAAHPRPRRTWWRRASFVGWLWTVARMMEWIVTRRILRKRRPAVTP